LTEAWRGTIGSLRASGIMIAGVVALRTVITNLTSTIVDFIVCVVIGVITDVGTLALLSGAEFREDMLVVHRSVFTRC
jgi:hypothetical protein